MQTNESFANLSPRSAFDRLKNNPDAIKIIKEELIDEGMEDTDHHQYQYDEDGKDGDDEIIESDSEETNNNKQSADEEQEDTKEGILDSLNAEKVLEQLANLKQEQETEHLKSEVEQLASPVPQKLPVAAAKQSTAAPVPQKAAAASAPAAPNVNVALANVNAAAVATGVNAVNNKNKPAPPHPVNNNINNNNKATTSLSVGANLNNRTAATTMNTTTIPNRRPPVNINNTMHNNTTTTAGRQRPDYSRRLELAKQNRLRKRDEMIKMEAAIKELEKKNEEMEAVIGKGQAEREKGLEDKLRERERIILSLQLKLEQVKTAKTNEMESLQRELIDVMEKVDGKDELIRSTTDNLQRSFHAETSIAMVNKAPMPGPIPIVQQLQ